MEVLGKTVTLKNSLMEWDAWVALRKEKKRCLLENNQTREAGAFVSYKKKLRKDPPSLIRPLKVAGKKFVLSDLHDSANAALE